MTFNKYVVWGFKPEHHYHTHGHIHDGLYRALRYLYGDKAAWLDSGDDISGVDFSNTIFITEHNAAKDGMPIRQDCFYVIHGMSDDNELRVKMEHISNRLSWNVYHDVSHGSSEQWALQGQPKLNTTEDYEEFFKSLTLDAIKNYKRFFLAEDTPYYPAEKHMDFRWATDLLPGEIEQNKKYARTLNRDSKIIHWVGTTWFVNDKELGQFKRACDESGIEFRPSGAGQRGVVTVDENQSLVRESYFSPAVVGSHHVVEGYAPCRIFKNISYGMMGVTNSKRVNDIFQGRLIYNSDPYQLFYDAREQLETLPIERVHSLMDYVAANHTYLNRIDSIFKAVKIIRGV